MRGEVDEAVGAASAAVGAVEEEGAAVVEDDAGLIVAAGDGVDPAADEGAGDGLIGGVQRVPFLGAIVSWLARFGQPSPGLRVGDSESPKSPRRALVPGRGRQVAPGALQRV